MYCFWNWKRERERERERGGEGEQLSLIPNSLQPKDSQALMAALEATTSIRRATRCACQRHDFGRVVRYANHNYRRFWELEPGPRCRSFGVPPVEFALQVALACMASTFEHDHVSAVISGVPSQHSFSQNATPQHLSLLSLMSCSILLFQMPVSAGMTGLLDLTHGVQCGGPLLLQRFRSRNMSTMLLVYFKRFCCRYDLARVLHVLAYLRP